MRVWRRGVLVTDGGRIPCAVGDGADCHCLRVMEVPLSGDWTMLRAAFEVTKLSGKVDRWVLDELAVVLFGLCRPCGG
jgi:hypothetical protein